MQRSPEPALSPREVVRAGLCIGCGSCASGNPDAAMRWDAHGFLKPGGPAGWLNTRTGDLARRCPFSPTALDEDAIAQERFPEARNRDGKVGRFIAAWVGHVAESEYRQRGSSGGMTSWVAAELLRTGAVDGVAHVAAEDPKTGRFFGYCIARSVEEIGQGAKSRYYPVELSGVLREIRAVPGRYAIIGVPCFIKAIHLLRRSDPVIREHVTHTLGLFCGHQKSARMIESFAWQLGVEMEGVRTVDYRLKDVRRPANWYRAHLELADGATAAEDWWNLADGDWGAGFFQNPACDHCDDVVAETADIAFGDAWVEPFSSDGRGTNVVIARSNEFNKMIEQGIADGRLALQRVDAGFIERTQAAGLRHRRDGLAYRLSWNRNRLRPAKRVGPLARALPVRRRLVYRLRSSIARWSNRMFLLARALKAPQLYLNWARCSLRLYQGVTWSRGRIGRALDRLFPSPEA
jgi:coenzyme F420-reducing hydrogenase beta subunit